MLKNIVSTPGPWPLRFVEAICTLLLKMCTTPTQNDDRPIWYLLLLWVLRGRSSKNRLLGFSEYALTLKRATLVEDSALRLQGGLPPSFPQRSNLRPLSRIRLFRSSTLHHGPYALPRRRQDATRCTQDAARAPQAAPSTAQHHPRHLETSRKCPPRRPNKRFPPSGKPLPLFGSNSLSIVIAAVVPAPCICGVLTTLGGRAGYGKNRKLFAP